MLCAIGLALGFRANVWNIGAEGQLIVGALVGGGIGLLLRPSAGRVAAAVDAGRRRAGRHGLGRHSGLSAHTLPHQRDPGEPDAGVRRASCCCPIWCTVPGAIRPATTFRNRPRSSPAATVPVLMEGVRTNLAFVLALLLAVLAWVFAEKAFAGFRLKVSGLAPDAASYAGFSEKRSVWVALLISGATAGLAGVAEVAGPIGQLQPSISPGYGFAAIIVAFVGRLHPARRGARQPADVAALHRRRDRADQDGAAGGGDRACSRGCCCSTCWRPICSFTSGCGGTSRPRAVAAPGARHGASA